MTCPYCTAGLYLNDTPGLGPCVCVTPERVEALEVEIAGRETERVEVIDKLRENTDHAVPDNCNLADAVSEGLDLAYAQGAGALADAADALRDYLTAQGLPAAPLRLADPHLDRLADLLLT